MSVFKCKMCGGNVEFENGATVGVCDSCGTKQTLPRLDDEKRANLYDRANHFRRNNEYDKAMGIYEQILSEDSTDSEAYWSLVLCRYGIEYVEDPLTHKRVPTVNRAQFTSIFADEDYKSALQYADGYQKEIYEQEAKAIDEIQKGILAISQKEEPFDIFICYKETDKDGRRTQDSVLANDLYHQLTQEGFKVFFSRITLEDKLGTAYEPYIFAALNSAKVMVVLGTKPEYFNAVWVKNEWSRYLALIKNGAKKALIPAYKDMDPYDLPEEFSHLQAQDMSKLGFMQDLIRGINKLIQSDPGKQTVRETVIANENVNIAPLLERAFMFLEDGEFDSADEYCEKVLDQDPKCARAYLGKLMAELKVRKKEDLTNCEQPFDESNNYNKALRFADEKLAQGLKNCILHINERNENARLEGIYTTAAAALNSAVTQADYEKAAQIFDTVKSYRDSAELAKKCRENSEICRKDDIYNTAKMLMNGTNESAFTAAIEKFEEIPGWKDADELIVSCHSKIEENKAKEELDRLEAERKAEEKRIADEKAAKRHKRVSVISIALVSILIAFVILLTTFIIPNFKYNKAVDLSEKGKYEEAYTLFNELNDYKDSANKMKSNKYNEALRLLEDNKLKEAKKLFYELGEYEESALYFKNIVSLPQKRTDSCHNYEINKYGTEVTDFKYDTNGNILSVSSSCPLYNGHCYQDEYTYENGKLSVYKRKDFITEIYSYDNDGNLKTKEYTNTYFSHKDHYLYKYFYENNRLIIMDKYDLEKDINASQPYLSTYYSYDESGNCIRETDEKETLTYSYNSNGYCITESSHSTDSDYFYKTEYTYDDSGNVLTEKHYENDKLDRTVTYSYDEFGNRIARDSEFVDTSFSDFIYVYSTNGIDSITKESIGY